MTVPARRTSEIRRDFLNQLRHRAIPMRRLQTSDEQHRQAFKNKQLQAWHALFEAALEYVKPIGSDRELARTLVDSLRAAAFAGIERTVLTETKTGSRARSSVPILSEGVIESLRAAAQIDVWFVLAALVLALADMADSMRGELSNSTIIEQTPHHLASLSQVLADPRLLRGFSQIAALNAADNEVRERIAAQAIEQQTRLEAEITRLQSIASEREQNLAELAESWRQFRLDADTQMGDWKEQVSAAIKLEANRNLWSARTKDHRNWALWAFGAMIGGVALTVFAVLYWALPALEPTLFEIMTRSGYVTQKLAIIAVCVIGIAWILRFVARAIVENMTLRADAQHRQTMLDTYLILRGEGAMSDEERHLILTALFRPLPGQHADEVAPPSPAYELVKKVTG